MSLSSTIDPSPSLREELGFLRRNPVQRTPIRCFFANILWLKLWRSRRLGKKIPLTVSDCGYPAPPKISGRNNPHFPNSSHWYTRVFRTYYRRLLSISSDTLGEDSRRNGARPFSSAKKGWDTTFQEPEAYRGSRKISRAFALPLPFSRLSGRSGDQRNLPQLRIDRSRPKIGALRDKPPKLLEANLWSLSLPLDQPLVLSLAFPSLNSPTSELSPFPQWMKAPQLHLPIFT